MEFAQKQLWLVNFDPAFGHEYRKIRPASGKNLSDQFL